MPPTPRSIAKAALNDLKRGVQRDSRMSARRPTPVTRPKAPTVKSLAAPQRAANKAIGLPKKGARTLGAGKAPFVGPPPPEPGMETVEAMLQLCVNTGKWLPVNQDTVNGGYSWWVTVDNWLRQYTKPSRSAASAEYLGNPVDPPGGPDPYTDANMSPFLEWITTYGLVPGKLTSFSSWTPEANNALSFIYNTHAFTEPYDPFTMTFLGQDWPGKAYDYWYKLKEWSLNAYPNPGAEGGSVELSEAELQATKTAGWWASDVRSGTGWGTQLQNYMNVFPNNKNVEHFQEVLQALYDDGGYPAGSLSADGMTALQGILDSGAFAQPSLWYTVEWANQKMAIDSYQFYIEMTGKVYYDLEPKNSYGTWPPV